MIIRFISLRLFAVAAVASGFCVAPALAQLPAIETPAAKATDEATQWEKLQRVNSAAKSIHVVWHCVDRYYAQLDVDAEGEAQSIMESARKNGLEESKVIQLGEAQRKFALRSQQEETVESTLDFVRIGNSVLCNGLYPAHGDSRRFIDFYDGTYSLHAINEFQGEISTPSGALTRDPKEILSMSAPLPQVARILLAIPFNQEFSPDNPALSRQDVKLQKLPNGDWSVTRNARVSEGKSKNPDTLIFGGEGAYLSSYEKLYIKSWIRDKDHKIIQTNYETLHKIVASEFKQYEDGIWFPSKIAVTSPNGRADYTLVEAQFNENVNPYGLTLPPDLNVVDTRFGGERDIVVYKTTEGRLMTDEEVKMKKFKQ